MYGVTEESQSQSPVHIPSQPIRKTTKEDIRKQVNELTTALPGGDVARLKTLWMFTSEGWVSFEFLETTVEPSCGWPEPLSAVCEQPTEAREDKISTEFPQQLLETDIEEWSQSLGAPTECCGDWWGWGNRCHRVLKIVKNLQSKAAQNHQTLLLWFKRQVYK